MYTCKIHFEGGILKAGRNQRILVSLRIKKPVIVIEGLFISCTVNA